MVIEQKADIEKEKLLENARLEADKIINDAKAEADRLMAEAKQRAQILYADNKSKGYADGLEEQQNEFEQKKADIERIMPYLQMKGVFIPNDEETIKSRGYVYSVNPAIYEFENFDAFAKEMRLFTK